MKHRTRRYLSPRPYDAWSGGLRWWAKEGTKFLDQSPYQRPGWERPARYRCQYDPKEFERLFHLIIMTRLCERYHKHRKCINERSSYHSMMTVVKTVKTRDIILIKGDSQISSVESASNQNTGCVLHEQLETSNPAFHKIVRLEVWAANDNNALPNIWGRLVCQKIARIIICANIRNKSSETREIQHELYLDMFQTRWCNWDLGVNREKSRIKM